MYVFLMVHGGMVARPRSLLSAARRNCYVVCCDVFRTFVVEPANEIASF
jgi:hypothetical protein